MVIMTVKQETKEVMVVMVLPEVGYTKLVMSLLMQQVVQEA